MTINRRGPLTCAQLEWFADLGCAEETPWAHEANFRTVLPVDGIPVGAAVTAIRDVIARHEGLRSVMVRHKAGDRVQQVEDVDERLNEVVRIVAETSFTEAFGQAEITSFRLAAQWPILVVFATDRGNVSQAGIVVDHSAIDAWGMRVLCADLSHALRSRRGGCAPFAQHAQVEQPLDTALWENGPQGAAYAERAELHWRTRLVSLREALADWSPSCGAAPSKPTLHSVWLASAKAATAAETIARTTGSSPSAAYLFALGSAIREVEGSAAAGVQVLALNRMTRGAQASVRKAVMPTPVVVPRDARGEGLAECTTQQLHGFRFANLSPDRVANLTAEILGDLAGAGAAAARFNYLDNLVVGSVANRRAFGAGRVAFTDPAVQGQVTAMPSRPGGSRYIVSVQHRQQAALITLACHEDTAWRPAAADMLWHIEEVLGATANALAR